MAVPPAAILGSILYFVYKRISLESQLVDYWWKVSYSEIEIVSTRRKEAGKSSSADGSQVSEKASHLLKGLKDTESVNSESHQAAKSSITKITNTSVAYNSSAAEVCYGDINLGMYKLAKVALKPISKFHQSRKLMIELRNVSFIDRLVFSLGGFNHYLF